MKIHKADRQEDRCEVSFLRRGHCNQARQEGQDVLWLFELSGMQSGLLGQTIRQNVSGMRQHARREEGQEHEASMFK